MAEAFKVSPREVLEWPAALFERTKMWLAGRVQAENDRAANRAAEEE